MHNYSIGFADYNKEKSKSTEYLYHAPTLPINIFHICNMYVCIYWL